MELNIIKGSMSDITYKSELILAGYAVHKQPGFRLIKNKVLNSQTPLGLRLTSLMT